MGKPFGNALELKGLATPAGNPPTGAYLLYFKSDGLLYRKNSAGVETMAGGGEPAIAVGTTAQYWRGDKSWQTLNKTAVGLGSVDNTPDSIKPLSTPVAATLLTKSIKVLVASTANVLPAFTTAVDGVSPAQGTWVLLKDQTNPAENGVWQINTSGGWGRAVGVDTSAAISGAVVAVQSGTNVGRIYTNNFTPTSTLDATAMTWTRVLDTSQLGVSGGAEAFIAAGTTAQYRRGDKSWQTLDKSAVGLANVDNTADSAKPVSTAQAAAITASQSPAYLNATTDYTNSVPPSPASGIRLFAHEHSARTLPGFVGVDGQVLRVQPFLATNRIKMFSAIDSSSSVAQTTGGLQMATPVGTVTAVAMSPTAFYGAMTRHRLTSAATAGAGAGHRTNTPQWFLSSTARMGGFHFVARFGVASLTATGRLFVGLKGDTVGVATPAFPAGANPSAQLNILGFGFDSADANMQFFCNDAAGVATKVDLGTGFPRTAVIFHEVHLYAPAGDSSTVYWAINRLDAGTVQSGWTATDIPAVNVVMAAHCHLSNGTTASATALDFQSLYVESDN